MSIINYYSEDVQKIKEIEFSIFRNGDIKKYSVVNADPFGIDLPESYENFEPKKGGLVDLRLGTCDIHLKCVTCGLDTNKCPGHFGHTDIVEPVFHFGFINHLKNILQCICLKCSNILIDKNDNILKKIQNKKNEIRFKEIKSLVKNINYCYNCNTPVPKIRKEEKDSGTIKILIERETSTQNINVDTGDTLNYNKKIKEYLSPRDCYNILRNISNNDSHLLGFNINRARPEDLIITVFPIPPVIIRPTAKIDFLSSATSEDSLTLKISDIIINNKRLRQMLEKSSLTDDNKNKNSNYINEVYNLLQYHVATYYNNDSVTLPRSEFRTGGKTTTSISDRLKGKYGRIRGNLMGKRVDFSSRSVITSDPYINIDQVGIPIKIAMELTIPEQVTPYNIKHLSYLVKNGRDKYPGANFISKITYRNGKEEIQTIDLKYRKKEIKLNLGDIVERHAVDGDYVLFNRQPTLHKPSMMGHEIQVINNPDLNTFRLNVSVCKPYNADFDGDEMNAHLPQSIQARNELKRIANVRYQIIGSKDSNPIIGCQQDSLSGAFMLTDPNVKIIGYEVANILSYTSSKSMYNLDMKKYYSGHELFSYIIPEGINIIKKDKLEIINGQLKSGYLDKSALSTSKNSIIHFVWDKYGPDITTKFIDDAQRLILNYLILRGQTVHFGNTIIPDDLYNNISKIISQKVLESKYNLTQFENDNNNISKDIIEANLSSELNIIQSNISVILKNNLNNDNFFWVCAASNARGSDINNAQIMAVIGQTSVEGSRIKKKIEGRSLIYFHRDDDTPEARGFVTSCYSKGLKGYEFFYNAMGGREGGIDTAIKTAQTGYIQRQLIKGLEDLSIKYDGTNRNAKGTIIQLVYGENGINQSTQTELVLNILNMNNKDIKNNLCFNEEQLKKINKSFNNNYNKFNNELYDKYISLRDIMRNNNRKSSLNYKIIDDKYMLPVNLFRITQDYSNNKENIKDLEPQYIIDSIENFLNDYDYRIITSIKNNDKYTKLNDRKIKFLFEIGLYEYLSPVKCIFNYGLDKNNFDNMIKDIKLSFLKAIVEPGEMVGIVAAQSIGEPTSQMTLNTKHSAGVAGKGTANMGVSRIQELLHYSKSIKTPQMMIYFKDEISNDKINVNRIVSNFKYLSIRELSSLIEVYYNINSNDELSKLLKNDNVSNPFFVNNQKSDIDLLPFVFRIKLNIEKLLDKDTSILDIKTKFISYWYKNFNNIKLLKKNEKDIISKITKCAILSNNITNKEQIIHIRFNMMSFNYTMITDFLKMILDDIAIKGFDNIENVDYSTELYTKFNNDGELIRTNEYVAYTSGINIEKMRTIKGIDMTRTRCNDIYTTYRYYGIEAARQTLLYELKNVYQNGGSNINNNHLSLLVDLMCHLGEIISIDRHGLGKIESDPIAKASFEKTMDHFINAAIFNEKDLMKSVSSRIALGRIIPGGTGSFELLLDTDKLENSEYTQDESGGRITFNPLEKKPLLSDIIKYGVGKSDFFIPKF
jgi:DNA-directed RNA polymerase II subunit RPB1